MLLCLHIWKAVLANSDVGAYFSDFGGEILTLPDGEFFEIADRRFPDNDLPDRRSRRGKFLNGGNEKLKMVCLSLHMDPDPVISIEYPTEKLVI